MAIGIDTSKWKPRKIKGTPAAKVRNILGVSVISIGILCGAYFHFSKYTEGLKKAVEVFYEESIAEVERRKYIAAGLPIRSSKKLRQMAEEEARIDLPYKYPKSTCEVKSKYFSSKSGMDESLSDFQEKKSFKAPKNSQATKAVTVKPKVKKTKKIKGQKDIRSALKGKKHELIAYSNDFDKVCKESGIDVDPEQLQLAIALSKSLQSESREADLQSTKSLTSQERSSKIRTTLKEYGFVVPDTKIIAAKSRKVKRYRKDYKLVQTSEEEKQQIIADKYSQVLFNNFDSRKTEIFKSENNSSNLYHIVTDTLYEHLKDNTIFYTIDIVENAPNSIGTLLRDWSEIPGRPRSPIFEVEKLEFDKIDCSQEELDSILSGTLKTAQKISRNKYNLLPQVEGNINTNDIHLVKDTKTLIKMDTECNDLEDEIANNMESGKESTNTASNPIDLTEVEDSNFLTVTQHARSYSPDIFEDDDILSSVTEESKKSLKPISHEVAPKNTTKACCEVIDLTECINTNFQKVKFKSNSQLSQGFDATKRKLNDFMDMTECVVSSSQPIRENVIWEQNVDLNQNSNNEEDVTIVKENLDIQKKDVVSMDLTQSSESDEDLPAVHISGKESLDETIILNEDVYSTLNNNSKIIEIITLDNTCSVTDIESEENIESGLTPIKKLSPPEDRLSITVDSEDKTNIHKNKVCNNLERAISPIEKMINHNLDTVEVDTVSIQNEIFREIVASVTDKQNSATESTDNCTKLKTESFFEDFVHEHSAEDHAEVLCFDDSSNSVINENFDRKYDNMDLTQKTDSSVENQNAVNLEESPKVSFDTSNLGKIGNVSIDYDEMFDDMVQTSASSTSQSKSLSSRSNITDFNPVNLERPSHSDLVSNSSQNSGLFEISDKELDYSLHKSRLDINNPTDNFDFGGISVVDNLPDLPSFRPYTDLVENRSLNRSMSDSYLPPVNIKSSENSQNTKSPVKSCSSVSSTPYKNTGVIAKTPKNGEYIVKTDGVTPMLDYEAMSTPEVGAELDKYGLKPFRRKRAIQLLTHLYNQTHPIVASCSQEGLPSKRRRPNTSPTHSISPKKISTMFKTVKFPKKKTTQDTDNYNTEQNQNNGDKENENLYGVTTDVPVMRNIGCGEDDWVFQKREKAKVHSCRVPLHIAFHNYVSTRLRLREAILRYEPVNIDVIHKGLVADGYRFDPKDLLKFMDKKCITVKTADNTKSKKHY